MLVAGNSESLLEAGFGLDGIRDGLSQQQGRPGADTPPPAGLPCPLASSTVQASASRRSPSSTCPTCPTASASMMR